MHAEEKAGPMLGWIALKWNYLGNLMRSLAQFAVGILLARLLGPEPFGIVAVAWLILGVGNLFSDLGFGAALVQRPSLTRADLRFMFTCQMGFACCLTLAGVCCAAALASYFHQAQATPVIQAMFFLFIFQSLGQSAAAVLRRAMDFKKLQQITIVSYLAGYAGVGIPGACLGWGVWSLVAAQIAQSLLNSLLLIRATAVPLLPCFTPGDRDMLRFGLKVTAANLSSWSISNLDAVFIGRAFGVVELGLYNRALNLVNMPMSVITTGFQGVLFAACARARRDSADPGAIRRIYLATNAAVALLCLPLFLTVAMVPDTLVLALYGPQWSASAPLVTPLALAVLVNALLAIKGPILMASNRVGLELRNQVVTVLIFLGALPIAVRYSVSAVAWAVLATYLARWILLALDTLRMTGVGWWAYAATFRTPLLFGLCASASAALADRHLAFLPPLVRLGMVAAVAGLVLLGMIRLCGARFLQVHLGALVETARLPGSLRTLLNI